VGQKSKLLIACYTLVDNFGKYGPISIILSLLQSVMNCGKYGNKSCHLTSHLKYVAAWNLWKLKVQQYNCWVVQN